jgi:sulfopyruvate decarboxylase subunit beta
MIRYEAFEIIMEYVQDEVVVCNLGHPCQELFAIRDRPLNFYMLGSMGLATSIGLGLAVSTSRRVVVLEGDGSMLMNLGSLATIGHLCPRNYVLIIMDNGSYGSTGFQDSFTARNLNLERVARACNIERACIVDTEATMREVVPAALRSDQGPVCIVAKVEKGSPPDLRPVPLTAIEIKNRFAEQIRAERVAES